MKFVGFPEVEVVEEAFADVDIRLVNPGETDYETAWQCGVYADAPAATQLDQIRHEMAYKHWWLQGYWYRKGKPIEQFNVRIDGEVKLPIYNYGEPLTSRHLKILVQVLLTFVRIRKDKFNSKIRYMVFDDRSFKNPYSGEPVNGEGGGRDQMLWISSNGRQFFPYRIPMIPNFEGTLIHECAHVISDREILDRWTKEFGWHRAAKSRRLPGGDLYDYVIDDPTRCVTGYAALTIGDDMAESMVAALRAPDLLDRARYEFLKKMFFDPMRKGGEVIITKRRRADIALPQLPRPCLVGLSEHSTPIRVVPGSDRS